MQTEVVCLLLCQLCLAFASRVIYEGAKPSKLRTRTFYMSANQEFQFINQILCEGQPCPEFSVVKDHTPSTQERSYASATFLKVTSRRRCNFKSVMAEGKDRIQRYIQGSNDREEKFPNTLPLLMKIDLDNARTRTNNPWCRMGYSMLFYVPHYWGLIPTPTQMLQNFYEFPDMFHVYAHTFTGEVEKVLFREIETFRQNLEKLQVCYDKKEFYLAIYETPHSPDDARTELWFKKCSEKKKV